MDTHERFALRVQENGVHRAGSGTLAATDAEALLHHNTSAFSLRVRTGGAGRRTGGRQAGKTGPGFKSCREAPGRGDPDSGRVPRQKLVHLAGTGEGTGMTADAPFHSWRLKDFHQIPLIRCDMVFSGKAVTHRKPVLKVVSGFAPLNPTYGSLVTLFCGGVPKRLHHSKFLVRYSIFISSSETRWLLKSAPKPTEDFCRNELAHEGFASGVHSDWTQLFLDAHELVVFLHALAATGSAGLEVTGGHRHGEVGDEAVHRLA
jgi:hypothetical protein